MAQELAPKPQSSNAEFFNAILNSSPTPAPRFHGLPINAVTFCTTPSNNFHISSHFCPQKQTSMCIFRHSLVRLCFCSAWCHRLYFSSSRTSRALEFTSLHLSQQVKGRCLSMLTHTLEKHWEYWTDTYYILYHREKHQIHFSNYYFWLWIFLYRHIKV